ESISIKVRMGLHTGAAEERSGDYFGPTLNRVARLMAAASGGQTLISSATKDVVVNALPQGVELRDLGKHRLRDLNDEEHIFQIMLAGLVNYFPPIKSLSPRVTNLPAQLTSFVGRNNDVTEVCRFLHRPDVRLMTLLGPGGIGKSRLSLQVGASLQDEYEDGIFFVALAPVSRPEAVIETIAQTLKVEEVGTATLLEAVKSHLHQRQILLVLDNFEQIIDAAPLVNELLAAAPRLKVLTTSREELLIYGEHVYQVAPLTLPEGTQTLDPVSLLRYSALALFVDRVRSTQVDFTMDTSNSADILSICRRLDGLPLAIELAAVRARDLSIHEIAEQLSNRLQTLVTTLAIGVAKQRTMRGAIEWSYDLLSPEEQQTFARLGVFVGAFTVEAADAIADAQTLNRLVGKSLIQQRQEDEESITFTLLETLREYAVEQLMARAEFETMQRLHADYYLQLTETAEPNLTGERQAEWFSRLEYEQNNVQAALEYRLNHGEFLEAGRMVGILWRFWSAHSLLSVGIYWIGQVLKHSQTLPAAVQARVRHGAGRLLFIQHRYPKAVEHLKASLPLYEQSGDQSGESAVYLSLGEIELRQKNILAAEGYFQNSLALYTALDDQAGFARCLGQLGRLAVQEGNLVGAEALYQQSLELIRQYGSSESIAYGMNDLAEVLRTQKKYSEASALYQESLGLYRHLHFDVGQAVILHNLGQVARQLGNDEEALAFFQEALGLLQALEETQIIAECLAGLGGVYVQLGAVEKAVRLLSAAQALMSAIPSQLDSVDQIEYDKSLGLAHRQLDDSVWSSAWAAGQSTSLSLIIASVLQE
ncbi:MAG: tetratricopeptide repeat protein, partial [Chloroflexota bacterium]